MVYLTGDTHGELDRFKEGELRRAGKGDTGWQHKLTDDQVVAIRATYTGTRGQQTSLARQYGVSAATISLIVRGLHRRTTDDESQHLGAGGPPVRAVS